MKLLYKLKDDQYKLKGVTKDRYIARGIVINDNNEVLMIHVQGDDIFGHRDYYETPGGGINEGENPTSAVIREIEEETGYSCKIIQEIGIVDDYYNLINRHNLNYYYLLKPIKKVEKHQEEYEKLFFKEIIWVNIDKAIKMNEETKNEPLAILVKRREIPIYKLAKEMITK